MFKLIIIYRPLELGISEIDVNREGVIVSIDDTRIDPDQLKAVVEHEVAKGKRQWEEYRRGERDVGN